MRTGLIAQKIGMSRYYTEDGRHIPVTLLWVNDCQVVSHKTEEQNGYNAIQIGWGQAKVKNVSKSVRGQFAKAKVEPKQVVKEFRVSKDGFVNVGAQLAADHFIAGQYVDVAARTIGKGFAGGMKRHNFGGLEATHGVSISHRSHGSTGQCQDPGRVFKGKKMAGHMGDTNVTVQNLEVIATDKEKGLIIVCGAVPGAKGGYVTITDAVKRATPPSAPFPASILGDAAAEKKANDNADDAEKVKAEAAAEAPQAEAPAVEEKQEEAKSEGGENNEN